MQELKKILPVLDKKELEDLFQKVLSSDNLIYREIELKDILIYLDNEEIDNLFVDLLKQGKDVNAFYPFVSDETYKNIIELYCADKLPYQIDVKKMSLFLNKDSISLLYKYYTK